LLRTEVRRSTIVLEETEAKAQAKSNYWMAHADREALAAMMGLAALDAVGGTAAALQGVAYFGITPIPSAPQSSTASDPCPAPRGSCSCSPSA
jgi:hypothetical protein